MAGPKGDTTSCPPRSRPAAGTIAPPEAAPAAGGGGAAGASAGGVRGAGSQPPLPPAALSRSPHRAGRGLCDAAATAADTKGRQAGERGAGPAPAPRPPPHDPLPPRACPLVPRPRSPRRGLEPSRAPVPTLRLRPERGGPGPGGRCGWGGDAEGLLPGAAARLVVGAEAAAGLPVRGWMPGACASLRFPPSRGASHGRRGS